MERTKTVQATKTTIQNKATTIIQKTVKTIPATTTMMVEMTHHNQKHGVVTLMSEIKLRKPKEWLTKPQMWMKQR